MPPLLVRNERGRLPEWLSRRNLKYFDFRANFDKNDFPGSGQIEDLWRWLVGLPADKEFAVSVETLRKRAYRLEVLDMLRSPAKWAIPDLCGEGIRFFYGDAPRKTITLGVLGYSFKLTASERGRDSIYIYADYVKAVGLAPCDVAYDALEADRASKYITPGRVITPKVGQCFVLMNESGALCVCRLRSVTCERNENTYVKPSIVFDYRMLLEK